MKKRSRSHLRLVLVAVALSLLVLIGWSWLRSYTAYDSLALSPHPQTWQVHRIRLGHSGGSIVIRLGEVAFTKPPRIPPLPPYRRYKLEHAPAADFAAPNLPNNVLAFRYVARSAAPGFVYFAGDNPAMQPYGVVLRERWFLIRHWLALIFISPLLTWAFFDCVVERQRKRRERSGRCWRCGYDRRHSPDRCPECGAISRS